MNPKAAVGRHAGLTTGTTSVFGMSVSRPWLTLLALVWVTGCASAIKSPAPVDLSLTVPKSEAERTYLGLPAGATNFTLAEIRAPIVVVDVFDMYCHACQSAAKQVVELYRLAHQRGLGGRLRFIGLGVRNSPLEVATYQKRFNVPFPVVPDRHGDVVRQFGELRLPTLIVLRNRNGRLEVVYRHIGVPGDLPALLRHIEEDAARDVSATAVEPVRAGPTCDPTNPVCARRANAAPVK